MWLGPPFSRLAAGRLISGGEELAMSRMTPPAELLMKIAPNGLCDDCIRDRVPINTRPALQAIMSELRPPHFSRSTGECAGCNQVTEVTKQL